MLPSPLRWGWIALAVVLLPLRVHAQPVVDSTTTLRLPDLLDEVRAANPSLRAERLRAEALSERPAQASALPDPTVGVSYQPFSVLTARGAQRTQWRVEQAVPFPGKRRLRGEIAALEARVARREADVQARDLLLDAKQAYYDLYRAQTQVRLVEAFQNELRGFEEVAATQYEVGRGPQQAILKAQIERNRLALRLEKLAADVTDARETLARLTDQPSTALRGAARVNPPRDAVLASSALVQRALAQRPEADALRQAQEQAARSVDLAEKSFWPDIMVSATYFDIADTDAPASADGRDALAVGIGIQVPLWRGRLRANLREAQLEAQQTDARYDALEAAIRAQVGALRSQLVRQRRQLTLLTETLLPQAETTREATLSAYSAGRTDFLDLLDAERTLFDLRLERADIRTRLLQTTAALERAAGLDLRPE